MTVLSSSSIGATPSPLRGEGTVIGRAFTQRPELILWVGLLTVFNLPMFHGSFAHSMVFLPASVWEGEWWRVLTHPFVHATWYHLALDGLAFLTLYHSLAEPSLFRRLG